MSSTPTGRPPGPPGPSPSNTATTTPKAQQLPSALDIVQFRRVMETATDQHARSYTSSLAMSFRWESDNTNPTRDAGSFQDILKAFSLPKAEELVIGISDRMPGLTIRDKLDNMLRTAVASSGRTLVLVHYAGHGQDTGDELHFVGPPGHSGRERTIRANRWIFAEVDTDDSFLGPSDLVDVIFFLDSCYSHLATRSPTVPSRVVEVLAAVEANDPFAFPPGTRPSFTSKLANEIAFRKGRGDQEVDFAELIQCLRAQSPVKKPTHSIRVGVNSIRLRFPGLSTQTRPPEAPSLQVVFTFRVSKDVSTDDLAGFVKWIKRLPRDIGLSLEDVFETSSVCLILRSSYAFYTKLGGLPGVQLVCETKLPSLLPQVLAAAAMPAPSSSHQPLRASGPNRNQENIPFRGKHPQR